MEKFSKKEAIKYGWQMMKQNFLFFIGLFSITIVVSFAFNFLIGALETSGSDTTSFFVGVLSIVVNVLIGMGVIYITLQLHNGKKPTYKDLTVPAPLFFKYIAASIIYGVIVFLGFLLLIVPGVIWALKYGQYKYLIIDQKLGVLEALKRSGEITKGSKWNLFLLGLLLGLINLLGVLALIVGLLVTMPLTLMAVIYVYKKLLITSSSTSPE